MKKVIFLVILALGIGGYFYFHYSVTIPKRALAEAAVIKAEIEYKKKVAEQRVYLLGHFDPKESAEFVRIPTEYLTYPRETYLRKETMEAFRKMHDKALADGVTLKLASATRNFKYQKDLWEKKWNGATLVEGKKLSETILDGFQRFEKILEYSAAPGSSRHHWGTDIDINGASPEYFSTPEGTKVYEWLTANAPNFGFCQVYSKKDAKRPLGYNEEKWHWSYLPIARQLTKDFKNIVTSEDIKGFLGDEFVPRINLINSYVLSINPECL